MQNLGSTSGLGENLRPVLLVNQFKLSDDRTVFVFRVKQHKNGLLELLDHEDEGCTTFRRSGMWVLAHRHNVSLQKISFLNCMNYYDSYKF